MMMSIAKKIALIFPPIRKLYEFALEQANGYSEVRKNLLSTELKLSELSATHEELKKQCEMQDLQLYVMRSDLQRAAVRNEKLSKALADLQDKYDQLQKMNDLSESINSRLDAAIKLIGRI